MYGQARHFFIVFRLGCLDKKACWLAMASGELAPTLVPW
jgi:hypothetical protein